MSYSLLAHLYPRIKGSQEDVATYSLIYILEQSPVLNGAFTRMICDKFKLKHNGVVQYNCQDADSEYGRPDIAGYKSGELFVLCEAKFYAGLTQNQPVSYINRLQEQGQTGLIFICPKNRVISLWGKLRELTDASNLQGETLGDYCTNFAGTHMSIISWDELIAELMRVCIEQDPERQGDLKQLQGLCEKMDSEAFIPFRPEDFGAQVARDIDRYYEVIDEIYRLLKADNGLTTNTSRLRKAPRWQGYSRYVEVNGVGVSIDYMRKLWKAPTSVETPFWCHLQEITDEGKWIESGIFKKYLSGIDRRQYEDFNGTPYLALIPKPYLSLEDTAKDLVEQIVRVIDDFKLIEN